MSEAKVLVEGNHRPGETVRPLSDENSQATDDTLDLLFPHARNQEGFLEKAIIFFFLEYYSSYRGAGLKHFLETAEKVIISRTLEKFSGHQRSAARFLGINPTTLCEKIKRFQKKADPRL